MLDGKVPRIRLTWHIRLPVPHEHRVSRALMTDIGTRQRRLANYQYIGLHDRDEIWGGFRDENAHLACVRHLELCLHDKQMCEQAGNILACTRNLTRLDVEGHRSIDDDANLAIWQLILRTFSVEHELPHLRSLRLKGLRLIHDDDTVSQLLGLRDLEHLQLILCRDYIAFLMMIGGASLKLKSFTLCEVGFAGGSEFDAHAEDFVRSMDSLQRLSLILDPDLVGPDGSLFDWSILHAHAAGIKSLKVHRTSPHRLISVYQNGSSFRHFFTKASSLQQLSISGIALEPSLLRYWPCSLAHLLVCLRFSQPKTILSLTDI